MKIHINKDKKEDKGFLGLGKAKSWWVVHAHYELAQEEKTLLKQSPEVLDIILFENVWKGIDYSPTVKDITDERLFDKYKGVTLIANTNVELLELERTINENAAKLKNHLMASKMADSGSTVNEI